MYINFSVYNFYPNGNLNNLNGYSILYLYLENSTSESMKHCNIQKMIDNCHHNRIDIQNINDHIHITSDYEFFYRWNMFRFLTQLIIYPIFCIVGIISSVISIIVLNNKNKKNDFESHFFGYFKINSYLYLAYCIITIFKQINRCILIDGIYCPLYVTTIYIQKIDLYVFKICASIIKLSSSATEFFISFSRFIKIADKRGKLFDIFKQANKIIVEGLFLVISLVLCSIKSLYEYKINYGGPFVSQTFPLDFLGINYDLIRFYIVIVYYAITIAVSFLSVLIMDLMLLKNIKKQNKGKLKVQKSSSTAYMKTFKECEARKNRIINMIRLNILYIFIIRFPEIMAIIKQLYVSTNLNSLKSNCDNGND